MVVAQEKVQGTDEEEAVALTRLGGALLVCSCGRFDISGAFNPGTGNRWCWGN